jgi:hypothetical protein
VRSLRETLGFEWRPHSSTITRVEAWQDAGYCSRPHARCVLCPYTGTAKPSPVSSAGSSAARPTALPPRCPVCCTARRNPAQRDHLAIIRAEHAPRAHLHPVVAFQHLIRVELVGVIGKCFMGVNGLSPLNSDRYTSSTSSDRRGFLYASHLRALLQTRAANVMLSRALSSWTKEALHFDHFIGGQWSRCPSSLGGTCVHRKPDRERRSLA